MLVPALASLACIRLIDRPEHQIVAHSNKHVFAFMRFDQRFCALAVGHLVCITLLGPKRRDVAASDRCHSLNATGSANLRIHLR